MIGLGGEVSCHTGAYINCSQFTRLLMAHIRQSLWDFFIAAFPRVTYCLSSATLTDDAVKDIQSIHQRP